MHYGSVCGYTSPLYIQRLPCGPLWDLDKYEDRSLLFLVDGFRLEITFQNIFFIIWNGSVTGMMVVFLYYNRAQSLLCHMPLNQFYAAGSPAAIKGTAYFNCPIPLLWIFISFLYLLAESLIFLLPV